jgi:protein-tyrosine phosphatase
MYQIAPHFLWLGHAREVGDFRKVFDAGIEALVELAAEEPPSRPPRELIYCRYPLLDGAGNDARLLYLAIDAVAALLERHVPTLICCSSGLSRSPAIAAAALTRLHGGSPEARLQELAALSPTDVSPGLWNDVTGLLHGESG